MKILRPIIIVDGKWQRVGFGSIDLEEELARFAYEDIGVCTYLPIGTYTLRIRTDTLFLIVTAKDVTLEPRKSGRLIIRIDDVLGIERPETMRLSTI